MATGEYVTFHDADDVSLPGRIAAQLAALASPEVMACTTNWLRVRENGSVVFFADGGAQRWAVVSLLARTHALRAVGPYPSARFGADIDVLRRLQRHFGPRALARLAQPWLLGLWSTQSVTRSAASESLESGFKSPARRSYSELLFQRDILGAVDDVQIAEQLVALGNWRAPAPLDRVQ